MPDPPDKATRGKTRPGRLRALDRWLLGLPDSPLDAPAPVFVDVGFGERLDTTVESARALRARHPDLRVVAPERDAARVERARGLAAREDVALARVSGFTLGPRRAHVARAMNVLRQHRPEDVAAAHAAWARGLHPGGLLLEGTCDRRGERLCAHALRRVGQGVVREALIFHFSGESGFAPIMLRDTLPQDLRRAPLAATPLGDLFADWTAAWERTRQRASCPRDAFARSARALAGARDDVDPAPWLAQEGLVVWRPRAV
jgi:hypothetical protein